MQIKSRDALIATILVGFCVGAIIGGASIAHAELSDCQKIDERKEICRASEGKYVIRSTGLSSSTIPNPSVITKGIATSTVLHISVAPTSTIQRALDEQKEADMIRSLKAQIVVLQWQLKTLQLRAR